MTTLYVRGGVLNKAHLMISRVLEDRGDAFKFKNPETAK
jgi:hypothetical protein